jgi:DNA mismatch repair protein MutS2
VDDSVLTALEFPEVLAQLRAETATPPGAVLAASVSPSFDAPSVERENALTRETIGYLERRGLLPFGIVPDPSPGLTRLSVAGSSLAPLEILDLLVVMKAGRAVKAALTEARAEFPMLHDRARNLPDLGNLIRFLDGKIATTGEIEDTASDELRRVRQDIRQHGERLQGLLDAIVARPEVARALQDTFVSIRSDRHVVPIRAEAQTAVPGIVHGVSGSGATVFVEPLETVDLNNEIVTLRETENVEVRRLLQEYSDLLRGRLAEIRALCLALGTIDLACARARLARRMGARPATTSASNALRLSGARHPLVDASLRAQGRGMVPLDLDMPAAAPALLISGPNTGGKTVALKTVGLLAVMHQSGMALPANDAALPVFRGIFIDIGDRQSIADHLSTFSARMKTIAAIATDLAPPALVLLDEIGSGTDPEEGAALGIAILDAFRARGAVVVATTHLEALKAHAATTPGCANAAMEFDESTFTPTYRLLPGVPGRSGALEIAERLGLPADIVEAARRRRGRSDALITEYLARLHTLSTDLEERLRQARRDRETLDRDRAALESSFAGREESLRRAVAAEIELALKTIREEGDRYIDSLKDRELAARLRHQETKAAAGLRETARALSRRNAMARAPDAAPAAIRPGMKVSLPAIGVRGTVESVRGDRVVLNARGKRVTAARADGRADGADEPGTARGPHLPLGVTLKRRPEEVPVPDELHLLGRTVEDALPLVDKYLDDAYLSGVTPVRIVHGLGSGRLKRAITDHLARHPHVEAFVSAPQEAGGQGVTVVTLRI